MYVQDGDQEGSFFRKQDQQGRVVKYVELLKFKVGACRSALKHQSLRCMITHASADRQAANGIGWC